MLAMASTSIRLKKFLDEFSFLEQLNWKKNIYTWLWWAALYHGRTVHSKADGLRIFKEVEVDLIAPPMLSMPSHYVEKMRSNGFQVRTFESIDEYLAQDKVAPIWYFTPSTGAHGRSCTRASSLFAPIGHFQERLSRSTARGCRFYHPLPRDRNYPTIPFFLDDLPLNGWDSQSINGYWTRIIEIAMLSGRIGEDFEEVNMPSHAIHRRLCT